MSKLALATTLIASLASAEEPSAEKILEARYHATLRELADEIEGVFGIAVIDLATGQRFGIHGDVVLTQASAIKLPILIELFRQVEAGRYQLDDTVRVEAHDIVGGSGVLRHLTSGAVTMTLRDIATLMVTVSDNTATNMIIDRVGMERVNATLRELGLPETTLRRKMMDAAAVSADRENVSTADEQAALLELLYREDSGLVSDASREEILRILTIPKSSRIRALLPPGTRVAHKTGTVSGVVVDVGIVYAEERPFIIALMGSWLGDATSAERVMSEIALASFDYFDRLGASNRFGHRK